MAHKTLINGTAYEITGGRTLVNGTGYSIDKGKTLVDGTAYGVGFNTLIVDTLYLRPSADVSFSGDKYPTSLTNGYLAISEEVSDEFATYIGGSSSTMHTSSYDVNGTFSLSLGTPIKVNKVFGGEVTVKCSFRGSFKVDGTFLEVVVSVLGVEYILISKQYGNVDGIFVESANIPSEMANKINDYVSVNGVFPEMSVYLRAHASNYVDGQTTKTESMAKIDQAYLALECEYIE